LVLHTLAAAFAENGRFEEAVAAAEKAITLATEVGNQGLAESTRSQLVAYREKKPWREAPPH
jgi:hypothetical protein